MSKSFCTAASTFSAFCTASEVGKRRGSSLLSLLSLLSLSLLLKGEEISAGESPFDFPLPFEAPAANNKEEDEDDEEEEVGNEIDGGDRDGSSDAAAGASAAAAVFSLGANRPKFETEEEEPGDGALTAAGGS